VNPLLTRITLALVVALLAVGHPAASLAAEATTTTTPAETTSSESTSKSEDFEDKKLDQSAFGNQDESSTKDKQQEEGSGGTAFRIILSLIFVVGVIFAVQWALKKWGNSRSSGASGPQGVIDVVATTNLAHGKAIHLIRVGEELVLVGATDQAITHLSDVDANILQSAAGNRGSAEFQSMLQGAMYAQQPGVGQMTSTGASSTDPFLKRFIDNLRMTTAR
jgi:flagellar protein FliO/FliZ